jgi:hypothetical protein
MRSITACCSASTSHRCQPKMCRKAFHRRSEAVAAVLSDSSCNIANQGGQEKPLHRDMLGYRGISERPQQQPSQATASSGGMHMHARTAGAGTGRAGRPGARFPPPPPAAAARSRAAGARGPPPCCRCMRTPACECAHSFPSAVQSHQACMHVPWDLCTPTSLLCKEHGNGSSRTVEYLLRCACHAVLHACGTAHGASSCQAREHCM